MGVIGAVIFIKRQVKKSFWWESFQAKASHKLDAGGVKTTLDMTTFMHWLPLPGGHGGRHTIDKCIMILVENL